jgi:hypothetical protein
MREQVRPHASPRQATHLFSIPSRGIVGSIVLTVSEPVKAFPSLGIPGVAVDDGAVDRVLASNKEGAEKVAARGAALAREAASRLARSSSKGIPSGA